MRFPRVPRFCAPKFFGQMRLTYPRSERVKILSFGGESSSTPLKDSICSTDVRRGRANASFASIASCTRTSMTFDLLLNKPWKCAICSFNSLSSASNLSASSPVNRRSGMARIESAWMSDKPCDSRNFFDADGPSFDFRIIFTTPSASASTIEKPSTRCLRSCAFESINLVRRSIVSTRNLMNSSRIWRRGITVGLLSMSATLFTKNFTSSFVLA